VPLTKDDYKKFVEQSKDQEKTSTLKWEPIFTDMSSSGDFGYTHGKYESINLDSLGNEQVRYGNYVTIWKKQTDGNWKFVFDAGNDLPAEEKE